MVRTEAVQGVGVESVGHTPGPWSWRVSTTRGTIYVEAPYKGNLWLVAEVGGAGRENEANADLIAAAPDLLAALDSCIDLLEFVEPQIIGGYSPDGALAQAIAAIRKARGQTNDTLPPNAPVNEANR